MRCPACQSQQPDGARSCSVCGKTLVTAPEPVGGDTLGASLPASAVEVADSTLEFAPAAVLREGMVFAGRYEIQAIIGRGGMGTVYRARDRHLEEIVALKLILPQLVPRVPTCASSSRSRGRCRSSGPSRSASRSVQAWRSPTRAGSSTATSSRTTSS